MVKVAAAVLYKEGKILLARRKSGKRLAGFWEFPGGKVEAGESLTSALEREMLEEFALSVSVGPFLAENTYSYEFGTISLAAFFIEEFTGEMHLTDHDRVEWASPEHLDDFKLAPADVPLLKAIRSFLAERFSPPGSLK